MFDRLFFLSLAQAFFRFILLLRRRMKTGFCVRSFDRCRLSQSERFGSFMESGEWLGWSIFCHYFFGARITNRRTAAGKHRINANKQNDKRRKKRKHERQTERSRERTWKIIQKQSCYRFSFSLFAFAVIYCPMPTEKNALPPCACVEKRWNEGRSQERDKK